MMKKIRKNQKEETSQRFIHKTNAFFEQNQKTLFAITMISGVLMSLFLFDVKVSLSGDDSDYILFADDFWHHFTFPGFRGPLYPIILSPFVGIFGMRLILLKSLSAVFILLSIWLLHKTFKRKIPAIILTPALFLVSICSYVFFYASHTYSEPLFMLFQSLFIYFFCNYFVGESVNLQLKTDWKKYLILGSLALCMGLTRSIGYSVLGVVILYFSINRRWKDLAYTITASVVVFCLFQIFKSIVWPEAGSAYDIQNYLAKDYYNLNLGMEDLPGFFNRFIENSHIYLSAFLCQFMGIIPETPNNHVVIDNIRTILIYLLFFICFIVIFKRSKSLLFIGIYAGVMNFVSFVLLQASWGQDRLIMIYYPQILIFLLGGIYYLFQIKLFQKLFFIYPIILIILCIGTFSITKNRIARNMPVLHQNLLGDQLYGLTPDWQNFIKGSQWAAKNLDKKAIIVSRKPSISKVYTGRNFVWAPVAMTVPLDTLRQLKNTTEQTLLALDISKYAYSSPYLRYVLNYNKPITLNEQKTTGVVIYVIPKTELEICLQRLQDANMNYTLDYDSFLNQCEMNDDFRIYNPDVMVQYLLDHHISYLLLPQLRIDPTQNTGYYINNIHKYIWLISYKYPEKFKTIHTIGKEEPCEIVQFIH